jgi:prepilin-type processing-associated H-X9-DG protein/prepilin-type N-terminal cleavage/methylation domain-containing protein
MRTRNRFPASRAFTLVELLVVVGIIAILIALLMPVLSKVREHSLRVKCQANLRSIGQAMTMYVQQYGYYPGCILAGTGGPGCAIWPIRLRPFTGDDQGVFFCPAQDERCEWRKDEPTAGPRASGLYVDAGYREGERLLVMDGTWFSYGYNLWGRTYPYFPPGSKGLGDVVLVDPSVQGPNRLFGEARSSRVKTPSQMIAVADASADGTWDYAVCADPAFRKELLPGAIHNRGANVLFCDGHVQCYSQQELTTILVDNAYDPRIIAVRQMRRMWDVDNQP